MDLTELYFKHKSFIENCAGKISRKYGCGNMLEDLVSVGTIAFLEHIGGYDENQGGAVPTFLYPHIIGAMRREIEKNFSAFSLSKREFEQMRGDGSLAWMRGVSLDEPVHEDGDEFYDSVAAPQTSPDQTIYIQICLEHMKTAFESLSYKEQEILGGFFGVCDHEEQTLAEIGEIFNMRKNAAQKSKDKALEKLWDICMNGDLGYWMSVRDAIRKVSRDIGYEPLPHDPVQILAERIMFCLECVDEDGVKQKIRILALQVVMEQLEFKAPETALRSFIRLTRSGHDPLVATEQIAAVLLEEVYFILKYNIGYNVKRYSRKLQQLL